MNLMLSVKDKCKREIDAAFLTEDENAKMKIICNKYGFKMYRKCRFELKIEALDYLLNDESKKDTRPIEFTSK